MENEPTILAIGRIERALSKIEQFQARPKSSAGDQLQSKHDILKRETQRAIAQIDSILSQEAN